MEGSGIQKALKKKQWFKVKSSEELIE